MIGRLRGRLDYRTADHVLIDVNGVGYIVHVSERTLAELPGPGGVVSLYTDLVVREDNWQLFGFLSLVEKEWHRLLMSVQGVGDPGRAGAGRGEPGHRSGRLGLGQGGQGGRAEDGAAHRDGAEGQGAGGDGDGRDRGRRARGPG